MDIYILVILILILVLVLFYYNRRQVESYRDYSDQFKRLDVQNKPTIKYFVINLDENKDRLDKILLQSQRENIQMERFAAIYGKYLDEQMLIQDGVLDTSHRLRKGQLGCAMSHIHLLHKLYHELSDSDYALILEDDIILPENIQDKIHGVLEIAPKNWDVIYLGGCNIVGKSIQNDSFIIPIDKRGTNLCTHAYLIKKTSIPFLTRCLRPLHIPIDEQWRRYFKDMNVYFVNPNIIIQDKDLPSMIRNIDGVPQSQYWKEHQTDIQIL